MFAINRTKHARIRVNPDVMRPFLHYDPETGALHLRDAADSDLISTPVRSDAYLAVPESIYVVQGTQCADGTTVQALDLQAAKPGSTRAKYPMKLSVKQIIYALHHGEIPHWIVNIDGDTRNTRIENLRGADTAPRWEGYRKQIQLNSDGSIRDPNDPTNPTNPKRVQKERINVFIHDE